MCGSLPSGQRCRPPPGELARGRRSLACRTIALSGGTWFAALRAACWPPPGELAGGRRSTPSPQFSAIGSTRFHGPAGRCRPEAGGPSRSRASSPSAIRRFGSVGVPGVRILHADHLYAVSWPSPPAYKGRTPGPGGPGVLRWRILLTTTEARPAYSAVQRAKLKRLTTPLVPAPARRSGLAVSGGLDAS